MEMKETIAEAMLMTLSKWLLARYALFIRLYAKQQLVCVYLGCLPRRQLCATGIYQHSRSESNITQQENVIVELEILIIVEINSGVGLEEAFICLQPPPFN
jgi:hypothetical protein